jgi:hypothetical protein
MIKQDFEILITFCVVGAMIALVNIGPTTKAFLEFSDTVKYVRSTNKFKMFEEFRKKEGNFWAEVKGEKIVSTNITNELKDLAKEPEKSPPINKVTPPVNTISNSGSAKLQTPLKFLLVGDSMMLVGFGPALEKSLLSYDGVSVAREGMYSTGLNRIDYYDWYSKTDELVTDNKSDILVVMFGANDGQGILDLNGNAFQLDDPQWKVIYRERVNLFLTKFSPKLKKIYWVGHPIAGNDDFMGKFQTMNPIYKEEIAKFPNVVYIDTWERFSVDGVYSQSIPDDNGLWQIAKQSDGVHVTDFGGAIMSDLVMKAIMKDVELK